MKLHRALGLLAALACLLPATSGFSRGGETGTLEDLQGPGAFSSEAPRMPVGGQWLPYFMNWDHYRRLRARLAAAPLAPVPGWESQRAWRFNERYFTEDGIYELLPLIVEPIR